MRQNSGPQQPYAEGKLMQDQDEEHWKQIIPRFDERHLKKGRASELVRARFGIACSSADLNLKNGERQLKPSSSKLRL